MLSLSTPLSPMPLLPSLIALFLACSYISSSVDCANQIPSRTKSSSTHSLVCRFHLFPSFAAIIASGVFATPRQICVTPTPAPTTGKTTAAANPAPKPLKNPLAPSALAPAIGAAINAAAPANAPFPTDFKPEFKPLAASFGRLNEKKSLKSTLSACLESVADIAPLPPPLPPSSPPINASCMWFSNSSVVEVFGCCGFCFCC
mmetsp:Transcript_7058/g.21932  ORF Transcript_7058/g.21932 Transcript_7058/m.21932 type:complete len:203 (-) Transcript_7058:41-649(-)